MDVWLSSLKSMILIYWMNQTNPNQTFTLYMDDSSSTLLIIQGVSKKMRRTFCLISPATSILEDWNIFHLKGDTHSFVLSTSSFLCYIREPRYEQNKMGYQISRIRNTVLLLYSQKKVIFGPKIMFFMSFSVSVVWRWYFVSWCF